MISNRDYSKNDKGQHSALSDELARLYCFVAYKYQGFQHLIVPLESYRYF